MWLIEKTNGVVFDEKKRELKTTKGEYLASIGINAYGLLEVWLGMNTDFTSDDGRIQALGWNGCEEHMGDIVRLRHGGGILEFQENRTSFSKKPGRVINIRIMMLEGDLVPAKHYDEPKPKSCLREIVDSISAAFRLKQRVV